MARRYLQVYSQARTRTGTDVGSHEETTQLSSQQHWAGWHMYVRGEGGSCSWDRRRQATNTFAARRNR